MYFYSGRVMHLWSGVDTIDRKDRNQPMTLDAALDHAAERDAMLLVNGQSRRAAVQVRAASLMLDDGAIERRVRLLRPMERGAFALDAMAQTHWRAVDRETFARAWETEIAETPEFSNNTLHVVAGLLLPIWKQLPRDSTRVYRLLTDDGERIVGRRVSPAWAASATAVGAPTLTPDDAFDAVLHAGSVIDLTEDLQLRRVRVMGVHRIELTGFSDAMRDRLTAYGLFHEIISWKLRMFVPVQGGAAVLTKVQERDPVTRGTDRDGS